MIHHICFDRTIKSGILAFLCVLFKRRHDHRQFPIGKTADRRLQHTDKRDILHRIIQQRQHV